jgi:RNase P/RNase MRP subunit POP5
MKKAATAVLLLFLAVTLISSNAPSVASARPAQEDELRETIRDRMVKLLGYVGLEKQATRTVVDRMVGVWSNAARPLVG